MIVTWEQKLYRAVKTYINKDMLDETRVQIVNRPLFFGKYKWALHFAPDFCGWTNFTVIKHDIQNALRGSDNRFVSSEAAVYYNIYANDPQILHQLRQTVGHRCEYSSILIVAPRCWHLIQPRPKNKGKFYHKFHYRIKVRNPNDLSPATYTGLMIGDWMVTKGFFYCTEVRDVMLFKLIHAQDIINILERP